MTVAVVMGSSSDLPVMRPALEVLDEFGIDHRTHVVSAHRDAAAMLAFGTEAAQAGISVIIAGAGGAAHLPGMLASVTSVPVIGVPVPRAELDGLDALLSIVQMPRGVPVATMAIGGAANAALLAVRILAASQPRLRDALDQHRARLRADVVRLDAEVQAAIAGPPAGEPA